MVSLMRLNSIDASTWLTGHLILCSMLDARCSLLLMNQLKNQCSISRRVKMLNAYARCRQRFANNWTKSGKCVSTYTSHKFHFLATHARSVQKMIFSISYIYIQPLCQSRCIHPLNNEPVDSPSLEKQVHHFISLRKPIQVNSFAPQFAEFIEFIRKSMH